MAPAKQATFERLEDTTAFVYQEIREDMRMTGGQTPLLIGGLILGLIVAVVIGVAIRNSRRAAALRVATDARNQTNPDHTTNPYAPDIHSNDPTKLRIGDLIEHALLGADRAFAIIGTLRFKQGGYTWAEHFVDSARGKQGWISVEKEGGKVKLVHWENLTDSPLTPGPTKLTYLGVEYMLQEDDTASYTSEGETDLRPSGTVEYFDYRSSIGTHLAFERFDHGKWEVSLGQDLPLSALTIYPQH